MARIWPGLGAILLAGLLAGCGGGDAEEPDPCEKIDARARDLAGTFIRQPTGVSTFEIMPLSGRVRRNGQLARLYFDGFTFRARADAETGGFRAGRGSQAVPVETLSSTVPGVSAYDVSYSLRSGDAFEGPMVAGEQTPATRLPTSGQAVYSGPVVLKVADRAQGSGALALTGTATFTVKYGSGVVDMNVSGLSGPGTAELPFSRIAWTAISVCSARIGSNGSGGFQLLNNGGIPVNFAGASDASPAGSAVFDGNFYGALEDGGQPAGIGGGFLIQGDAGMISGIVVAKPAN